MKRFARYRPRQPPGTMNKLETAYSEYLFFRKKAGDILRLRCQELMLDLQNKEPKVEWTDEPA
jgi:hypothetical protein